MKYLFFCIILLSSLKSMSQDSTLCSKYIERTSDEMTGKETISGKYFTVSDDGGKTGFGLDLILGGKKETIILGIVAVGAGNCIDDNNIIYFLFTDGTRLQINSSSKFNCKGNSAVYFGGIFGNEEQLNVLMTKTIKSMRVDTHSSYVQKSLTTSQATQFKITLSCLNDIVNKKGE